MGVRGSFITIQLAYVVHTLWYEYLNELAAGELNSGILKREISSLPLSLPSSLSRPGSQTLRGSIVERCGQQNLKDSSRAVGWRDCSSSSLPNKEVPIQRISVRKHRVTSGLDPSFDAIEANV